LTTTDTLLDTGAGAATVTLTLPFSSNSSLVVCNPPYLNFSANYCYTGTGGANEQYWELLSDWFAGNGQGSGSETLEYGSNGTENGSATLTVAATGTALISGVSGYPNISYGTTFGLTVNGQPPQFPFALSAANQFNVDGTYDLTGTITGINSDILWDEWIGNPTTGTSTEVAIYTYYDFQNPLNSNGTGTCSGFVQNFTQTVTINGTATPIAFQEYDAYLYPTSGGSPCGSGSAPYGGGYGTYGDTVFFLWPGASAGVGAGYADAEIAFNAMPFEVEALNRLKTDFGATAINAAGPWTAAGNQFGTEFGDTTAPNFSLSITKMQIQTVTGTTPNAPQELTGGIVSGGKIQ
jgi:hypothetical protein